MNWTALEDWLLVRGGPRGEGWAPSTVRQRLYDLKRLTRWNLITPDTFTIQQGDQALASLRRRNISTAGYNNYIVALSGLARYHGLEPTFTRAKREKADKKFLSKDEIKRLLTYRHPDDEINRTHRAVLVFAINSGLRPSEAQRLTLADLDPETGTVHVHKTSKHGLRRRLPLDRWMWMRTRPFGAYVRWRHDINAPTDALFITRDRNGGHKGNEWRAFNLNALTNLIIQIGRETGVRVNWRTLRRTRATELLRERGLNPVYVSRMLGHNKLETTMEYLEVTSDDLLRALRRSPAKEPF